MNLAIKKKKIENSEKNDRYWSINSPTFAYNHPEKHNLEELWNSKTKSKNLNPDKYYGKKVVERFKILQRSTPLVIQIKKTVKLDNQTNIMKKKTNNYKPKI